MLSEAARAAKVEKDRARIAHYRRLTNRILDMKHNNTFTQEALDDTTAILEMNPELNAAWNFRRNIILALLHQGKINAKQVLNQDLRMTMEQLKAFPKCYWIWNHRTWCLQELEKRGEANWDYELAIVLKLLELDSRNFHGWHYRRYIVQHMKKNEEKKGKSHLSVNLTEFAYTTSKINKNISNFSAWHNRTKLIPAISDELSRTDSETLSKLSKEASAVILLFSLPQDLLQHELDLVRTGMYMDANDTSVWLYLQWLLTEDIFVSDLRARNSYEDVLESQLKEVEELNDLERLDSPTNSDNVWCLKTIIFIKGLMNDSGKRLEITDDLKKLVELDPLRRGRYMDQIQASGIVC